MKQLKIVNSTQEKDILLDNNKIRLRFDIINQQENIFYDCCLKVILDDQILRHDLPKIAGDISGIEVEFENKYTFPTKLNATCKIYQGDRIIIATDHTLIIK